MTVNSVGRLCDACMKGQGQMILEEIIAAKVERGTQKKGTVKAARVTFEDGHVVYVNLPKDKPIRHVPDRVVIDFAIKLRKGKK